MDVNERRIGELLRSRELQDRLAARGERIARAAGPGYTVTRWTGRTRVRVSVATGTFDAMRDSRQNHSLLKAIDAGRDA